jgi:hypothetical protein
MEKNGYRREMAPYKQITKKPATKPKTKKWTTLTYLG